MPYHSKSIQSSMWLVWLSVNHCRTSENKCIMYRTLHDELKLHSAIVAPAIKQNFDIKDMLYS